DGDANAVEAIARQLDAGGTTSVDVLGEAMPRFALVGSHVDFDLADPGRTDLINFVFDGGHRGINDLVRSARRAWRLKSARRLGAAVADGSGAAAGAWNEWRRRRIFEFRYLARRRIDFRDVYL